MAAKKRAAFNVNLSSRARANCMAAAMEAFIAGHRTSIKEVPHVPTTNCNILHSGKFTWKLITGPEKRGVTYKRAPFRCMLVFRSVPRSLRMELDFHLRRHMQPKFRPRRPEPTTTQCARNVIAVDRSPLLRKALTPLSPHWVLLRPIWGHIVAYRGLWCRRGLLWGALLSTL